jgi:hypothetical protein
MSLKNEIKSFARSEGVDLVGVAGVEDYRDYLADVRERFRETAARLRYFSNVFRSLGKHCRMPRQ